MTMSSNSYRTSHFMTAPDIDPLDEDAYVDEDAAYEAAQAQAAEDDADEMRAIIAAEDAEFFALLEA